MLRPPRDWLYQRCDQRFDAMMAAGALDEVRALPPADPNLTALKALGIPQLRAALAGEMPLADAVVLAKTSTRQYAKRQMTWFKKDDGIQWFQPEQKEEIISYIGSQLSL